MASALIGGLQNNGIPPSEIAVIEINEESRARLEKDHRVRCYAEPDADALNCDATTFMSTLHRSLPYSSSRQYTRSF